MDGGEWTRRWMEENGRRWMDGEEWRRMDLEVDGEEWTRRWMEENGLGGEWKRMD